MWSIVVCLLWVVVMIPQKFSVVKHHKIGAPGVMQKYSKSMIILWE